MEIAVGMGEIGIAEHPHTLRAIGVGSCVAVALHDNKAGIGGLAHVVLPYLAGNRDGLESARFSDGAIRMMIAQMKTRGTMIRNIIAKVFGGANMFPALIVPGGTMDIGSKNVQAVRQELAQHGIPIAAEEVGEHIGRTVLFDPKDGSIIVKTAATGTRAY